MWFNFESFGFRIVVFFRKYDIGVFRVYKICKGKRVIVNKCGIDRIVKDEIFYFVEFEKYVKRLIFRLF